MAIDSYQSKLGSLYQQIVSVNKSMPDSTSTISQKQQAVRNKDIIIDLSREVIELASANGDNKMVLDYSAQIPVLEQEKATIEKEIKAIQDMMKLNSQMIALNSTLPTTITSGEEAKSAIKTKDAIIGCEQGVINIAMGREDKKTISDFSKKISNQNNDKAKLKTNPNADEEFKPVVLANKGKSTYTFEHIG